MKLLLGSLLAAVLGLGWLGSESASAAALDDAGARPTPPCASDACPLEACPLDACPLQACGEGACPGAGAVRVERLDGDTCRVTCEAPGGERCTVLVDCDRADCALRAGAPQEAGPRDCGAGPCPLAAR